MYPKLEFLLYGNISVFLTGEVPSFIPTDVASACSLCHMTQSNPFVKMAAAKNKNDDMELTRVIGRGILEARAQEENVTGQRNDIQEISTFIPGATSTPTPTFIPGATSTLIPTPRFSLLREMEKLKEENEKLKKENKKLKQKSVQKDDEDEEEDEKEIEERHKNEKVCKYCRDSFEARGIGMHKRRSQCCALLFLLILFLNGTFVRNNSDCISTLKYGKSNIINSVSGICIARQGGYFKIRIRRYSNSDLTFQLDRIKVAGDISTNPGPDWDSSSYPSFQLKEKGLKVCHLNVRSLPCHYEETKLILLANKFDLFAISESWLNSTHADAEV